VSRADLKKFLAGGRNSRQTMAPGLGGTDPRIRGGMQRQRSGDDLGAGIDLDRNGRATVQLDPRSPLKMGPNGITIDPEALGSTVAGSTTFNTTITSGGGGGGGGGGGTVIINNLVVEEVLDWINW
jgi:hypothetical protein